MTSVVTGTSGTSVVTGTSGPSPKPARRGKSATAEGPVDIGNWSLFGREDVSSGRPTPFLVGPIVGEVTETTAR